MPARRIPSEALVDADLHGFVTARSAMQRNEGVEMHASQPSALTLPASAGDFAFERYQQSSEAWMKQRAPDRVVVCPHPMLQPATSFSRPSHSRMPGSRVASRVCGTRKLATQEGDLCPATLEQGRQFLEVIVTDGYVRQFCGGGARCIVRSIMAVIAGHLLPGDVADRPAVCIERCGRSLAR